MRFLLILLMACGEPEAEAPRRGGGGPVPVKVHTVVAGEEAVDVPSLGSLVADAVVELRPEVAGRVEEVRFTDGEVVKQGQLLVRLRDVEAKAALAEADATLALAEADRGRAEQLRAKDHIAVAELEAATARRDLATAARDRAAEAVRRTRLVAPFDGQVGVRGVQPGDQVDTGRVLTVLYDLDPVRAELSVPERLAGWVAVEQPVSVTVDAWPDQGFAGVVRYVAPAVDPASRTLVLRAEIPNADGRLRPGMTARGSVQVKPPGRTLLVPAQAITTRAEGPMVWVIAEDKASLRPVTLGERRADDVVVLTGLEPGEVIAVEGLVRLRDGVAVAVADGA